MQVREQGRVGGDDHVLPGVGTLEALDNGAGLPRHESAARQVPHVQAPLPVPVDPALGDRAQVQCGRPGAAYVADAGQHMGDDGLLYTGHSENYLHAADLIQPCGRTLYRRAKGAGA